MTKPNPGQSDQKMIRRRYDFIAKWHDAAGTFVTPHRRDAVRALNAQAGERILDLACGTGINFKRILTQLGPTGLLLGLDYSSGMLEQAHRRVRQGHWSNVVLFLGDAARLPFADCVFDRAICTYSLKVIPPYQQALDEVLRVLKPGGTFVVLDGKLGTGATRFLNPLIKWMAGGPQSDIARPLVDEMVQRFQEVRIAEYDLGHAFVATARKE